MTNAMKEKDKVWREYLVEGAWFGLRVRRGFSRVVTFDLRNEGQVAVHQLTGLSGRESIPSTAYSWHCIHEMRSNLPQPCPSISHSTL